MRTLLGKQKKNMTTTLFSPVKMFLSSRQNGWSSRQQRQQAHLDAILFVTARAFSPVHKTYKLYINI